MGCYMYDVLQQRVLLTEQNVNVFCRTSCPLEIRFAKLTVLLNNTVSLQSCALVLGLS